MWSPSGICDHETAHDDAPDDLGGLSCCRPTWDNTRYCVWHAEKSNKSATDLTAARLNRPERIDDLFLQGTKLNDNIFFIECTLWNADFSSSRLSGAKFDSAYLYRANFSGTDISQSDFTNCYANNSQFKNVTGRSAKFVGSSLMHANFSKTNPQPCILSNADFSGADLFDAQFERTHIDQADFSNTRLTHASFVDSYASQADFDGADVRDTDFTHSILDGSYFANARISAITKFGNVAANERIADKRAERSPVVKKITLDIHRVISYLCYKPYLLARSIFDGSSKKFRHRIPLVLLSIYAYLLEYLPHPPHINRDHDLSNYASDLVSESKNSNLIKVYSYVKDAMISLWRFYNRLSPEINFRSSDKRDLEAAVRTYKNYQTILEGTPQKDTLIHFSLREKAARRKLAWTSGNFWSWLKLSLSRWIILHGEGPWRIGFVSIGILTVFTFLYPNYGLLMQKGGGDIVPIVYGSSLSLPTTLKKSFYFSVITFTTLGYGDIQPVGMSEYLAMAETILGSIMIALLVFVLGRKAVQ